MKKQKIGTILYTFFAAIIFMVAVLSAVNYEIIQNSERNGDRLYVNYGKVQGDLGLGYSSFQEVKVHIRNILYISFDDKNGIEEEKEKLYAASDDISKHFKNAEKSFIDEDVKELYETTYGSIQKYLNDVDAVLEMMDEDKVEAARDYFLANAVSSANTAAETIDDLVALIEERADEEDAAAMRSHKIGNAIAAAVIVMIVVGIIILGWIILKIVKKPLVELAKAADAIAKGDVSHDIDRIDGSKNEVALLQNSFADMVDNLKSQANALYELSQGNLDVAYKAASEKDEVGKAIEKLIADDNMAFGAIRSATNQISIGSGQIAAASQTLAQGSTQQASAIQQIAASITDIANKTKDNASQANEVNDIVKETKTDVVAGNERMNEMVGAMREINEASENIQKIIKVIDDIAFNTNILALNATVEAARAGEQGKGFAVVAEEVRNLAGRSAEASSQTAEMIEDSIVKVKRGSELAQETAKALSVVSDRIDRITGLSADIASASNDQAAATAQIDQALAQVSQVVQTNSATSQQCASASEELSGQAHGLEREISKFRLKDAAGSRPAPEIEYEEPMRLDGTDAKY